MHEQEISLRSQQELHEFVHRTLCAAENLLAEQFQTRQQPLYRGEAVCGMEFSLAGLRSVRLGAIWAADQNILYFYNARGERMRKVRLLTPIPLVERTAG